MAEIPVPQTEINIPPKPVDNPPKQPLPNPTPVLKTKNQWLISGLIGFVVIALGLAGYFTYQNLQLKKGQSNLTQPAPSSVANSHSPSPNPTIYLDDFNTLDVTNWKEITINKSGFGGKLQFLIPPDVNVCDTSDTLDGPPIPNQTITNNRVDYVLSEDNSTCFYPTLFIKDDDFPYGLKMGWTYMPLNYAITGMWKNDMNTANLTDFGFGDNETYIASGEADIRYSIHPQTNPSSSSIDTITKKIYYEKVMFHKEKEGQLIALTIQTKPDKTNLNIYRQILATFKFIEATANWKTYTNTKYSYTFKCPPTSSHSIELNSGNGLDKPLFQEICYEGQNQMRIYVFSTTSNPQIELEGANVAERSLGETKVILRGFNYDYFTRILSTFQFTQ